MRRSFFKYFVLQFDLKSIVFIAYNFSYIFYMLGQINRNINLVFLSIFIVINVLQYIQRSKIRIHFQRELVLSLSVVIFFVIITLFIQMINNNYYISQLSMIWYILIPPIVAFFWINTTREEKRDFYFIIFFIRFSTYFLLVNVKSLSLAAIKMINFSDTFSSIFESSDAHSFLFLTLVFLSMNRKILGIISGIFCMLCFKRLSFVLIPVIILFYKFIPNKKVNNTILFVTKLVFCISPFLILFIKEKSDFINDLLGINLENFTTGRLGLINYVMNNIRVFNGFGTVSAFMQNNYFGFYKKIGSMHCDILQIYLETTILGVLVYTRNLFEISKRHYKSFILLVYIFIEMIISHFVDVLAGWLIFYMYTAKLYTSNEVNQ